MNSFFSWTKNTPCPYCNHSEEQMFDGITHHGSYEQYRENHIEGAAYDEGYTAAQSGEDYDKNWSSHSDIQEQYKGGYLELASQKDELAAYGEYLDNGEWKTGECDAELGEPEIDVEGFMEEEEYVTMHPEGITV